MPKRNDIRKILIIGAGPIIIGQACEFDYSGTQACKALKEEGYEVVLVNSNPATIMTDPTFADRTYIEPISPECVRKVIEIERPDALLPTMGGQTALNVAVALAKDGTLAKYGVELIGAKLDAIEVAEDRDKFRKLMAKIGLKTPRSEVVTTLAEGQQVAKDMGFPLILRPAFTLGGYGGGIAYNHDEFDEILVKGLNASPMKQVLVEQSVLGWKELEFEVMRDLKDNVVIICTIENLDPMGVHTGDSITVAPVQTLTDREFQALRDASIKVIRAVGVETGGSNIQFAMNPENSEIIVIEMNPRVSRSSALASKATGFPIAKIAAKLAVGYTLDEIPNDITKTTMASFEPSIDYVVTKIPRFSFEKFRGSKDELGTQMKSIGETMAVGRSFKESFQKAVRGLEKGHLGFINPDLVHRKIQLNEIKAYLDKARKEISLASSKRIMMLFDAFYLGLTLNEIYALTKIDKWFLAHLKEIVEETQQLERLSGKALAEVLTKPYLLKLKAMGFSDAQLAVILQVTETDIRKQREALELQPIFKTIDTCAAEFESFTPYYYSSYDEENEVAKSNQEKVIIIGGGPNRIGQGIEFDYCCVHASQALREAGYETIMVNNNPETVSTDYDISSRLYFEPITPEDVMAIWHSELNSLDDPSKLKGVIVQLGGQTPLNICRQLQDRGVRILGTSPESIHLAEDRDEFGKLLSTLGLKQTLNAIANTIDEAKAKAEEITYPVVLRPSYVLGGRGMEIAYSEEELSSWLSRTIIRESQLPILIDKFLDEAIEVDVDAVSDGTSTIVAGIMEHIEYAGIHSGDSACVYPPQTLSPRILQEIDTATRKLATALKVRGLMNIQFAVKNEELYILEVNPRASRSVPFISKATGIPWAKVASLVMLGRKLNPELLKPDSKQQVAVKEAVFSFNKFDGTTIFLGPEMKSTGEVMGISKDFSMAFAKAQLGSSLALPRNGGKVFCSFSDKDKSLAVSICQKLEEMKYEIVATSGTANFLEQMGVTVQRVAKVSEGRPNISDMLKNGEISLIFNVPAGREAYEDSTVISKIALSTNVPVITTITGAAATVQALESLKREELSVRALQEFHSSEPDLSLALT